MMRGVEQIPTLYDLIMLPLDKAVFEQRRQQLFGSIKGDVLEIGVGTGLNLDVYGSQAQITAVDIGPQLLAAAKPRARQRGANILLADAQQLPFPDACFDYVTAALVFCTIPNPVLALQEIARVLRRGGRLVQLEHTRTNHVVPDAVLNFANPVWKVLTGGCHINRDTPALLMAQGWHLLDHQRYGGGLLRTIEAVPPQMI
jgi:ubiquinone/menaquinone biosynthesis C-methylase UbiE